MASVQVGALVEVIEIYVRFLHVCTSVSGSDDGIELVQNDLKLHHGTVAVHILHTDVHVLIAPQLSPVSSELHPAAYLIGLLLSPTFCFLHQQYKVAPAQHPSATSLTNMKNVLFLVD